MKQLLTGILILFIIELITLSCANPISPTGGAKDTIPPQLIWTQPMDQSLNFKDKTITLSFDEHISADKLKQNLIITPFTDVKYKTLIKKFNISLVFEEAFEDSTTYTLNFADGITDITERNPAENLIIAFSTGSYIDSLQLFGNVYDLFSGKSMEKVTVGIYRITDSLQFEKTKPTYFMHTDKAGNFSIQNIKANAYRLMAFKDENSNLIFDPASEAYGFLADTLHLLTSSEDSIRIPIVAIDASDLRMISARPTGKYFEAKYTKPITGYHFTTKDSLYIPTQITGESQTLRFYPHENVADSLYTIITVNDSLYNTSTDTVYVRFRESSRKPSEFKTSLTPKSGSAVFQDTPYSIKFNKPTQLIDSSFALFAVDTFYTLPAYPQNISFNFNKTELKFNLSLNADTWKKNIDLFIAENEVDSLKIDSAKLFVYNKLKKFNTEQFELKINPASFVSTENDSSTSILQKYKFAKMENYGVVRVNLVTDQPSYIVQLMTKDQVVAQTENCSACVFHQINPGDYWVRVLIDSNNDGKWSYGNFLKNETPETIVHFPEKTTLRANWDIQLDYSF